MREQYNLLVDPKEITAAFSFWRKALEDQGTWRGDSWWLPQERIVFGNRNDRTLQELGKFVVLGTDPTGQNVTVQLNEPQQYGNENPLSGVVRCGDGRLHLVRQGVLHQNAQSLRVDGPLFAKRTRLSRVDVTIGRAAAKRWWFIVTALDLPSSEICRNLGTFVDLCSVARGVEAAAEVTADEERLEELFGKPETGGESEGEQSVNFNRRRHLQGEVWLALQALLAADGRALLKPRHARGFEVDGEIVNASYNLLLEIKTGVSAAEVYAGVGQLAVMDTMRDEQPKGSSFMSAAALSCLTLRLRRGMRRTWTV